MLTSTWAASRSVFAALGEVHLYQCRRDASTSRGNRHLSNGGTKPPRRCSLRRWHAELCLTWPISHNTTLLFGNHTAHKLLSHGRLQAHDRPARGRVTTITDSTTRARSFVRAGHRCTTDASGHRCTTESPALRVLPARPVVDGLGLGINVQSEQSARLRPTDELSQPKAQPNLIQEGLGALVQM